MLLEKPVATDMAEAAEIAAASEEKLLLVGHLLRFELRDVAQLQPPAGDPGIVICNPPYGERIGEEKELREVYRTLGAVCRDRFAGWRVFVFTGNPRLAGYIGMAPVEQTPFWNGKIACRLLEYRPS